MPAGASFATDEFFASEITPEEIAELQAFEEANPEYWLETRGHPPAPDSAARRFEQLPPADMSYSEHLQFLVRDASNREILAQIDAAADLMASGVYHLGFFMTATRTHGSGLARRVYDAYEQWAIPRGARWLRLGVFAVNARAHAFWRRVGYVEVRRKEGYVVGTRTHVLITMVKPKNGENLGDYLDAVPRDRAYR